MSDWDGITKNLGESNLSVMELSTGLVVFIRTHSARATATLVDILDPVEMNDLLEWWKLQSTPRDEDCT